MAIRDDIVGVLTRAEDQLTSRLQKALKDREYSDVAELASVSQQVQELIQSMGGDERAPARGTVRAKAVTHSEADDSIRGRPADNGRGGRAETYPKFVRDGDRLVKIGWSRRDRTEYEHRALTFAVSAVVSALQRLGSSEFSMDALTPVRDEDGTEVPSYQVYLVVAWLRACKAVEKVGRGGYVPIPERLTVAAVKEHWAQLGGDPASEGALIDD